LSAWRHLTGFARDDAVSQTIRQRSLRAKALQRALLAASLQFSGLS
jgi:hypothetical protein